MEPEALYKNTYTIGYSDIDFTKRLKLSTLFGYFQDTASVAASRLGLGLDTLTEQHSLTWVLMRMRVEIVRNPLWNEEITIATWPHPPGKLEFERDYKVLDAGGIPIIRAASNWLIIDINTREVKRTDLLDVNYPPFIEEHALDTRLGRIRPSGRPEVVYRKVIGYSDVDLNGHINNARYIDFIMDCFPVEGHRMYFVKAIEVNYVKEAFPGDILLLCRDVSAADENRIYIEGVREQDGKTVFKAQVETAPR